MGRQVTVNFIDPMQAQSRRDPGKYIAQATGQISQLFASLPEAMKQDVQTKGDLNFKKDLYETATEGLRKVGVDSASVNLPDFNDERITKEQYAEALGNALAPYAEGEGARLTPELFKSLGQSQNPNVQEQLQKQNLLTQLDPLSRLDFSKMQTIQPEQSAPQGAYGPALPEGAQSSIDPMTGAGTDYSSGAVNIPRQMVQAPLSENPLINSAAPYIVEALKSGTIPAGKISEKLLDLELENTKMKAAEQKAKNDYWVELFKAGYQSGRPAIDKKTGAPVAASKDNYEDLALGDKPLAMGGIGTATMVKREDFKNAHGFYPGIGGTSKTTGEYISPEESLERFYNYLYSERGIDKTTQKTAATTAATVNTKREIQKDAPILAEGATGALGDAALGIKYLNELKKTLQSGNIAYFDLTKAGDFTNPAVANPYTQLKEIVGRNRSGAAISSTEWSNFAKQILNKNFLLTEEGRQAALASLDDYLDRFYGSGMTLTGDESWLTNYQSRVKKARQNSEGGGVKAKKKRYNPETGAFEVVE